MNKRFRKKREEQRKEGCETLSLSLSLSLSFSLSLSIFLSVSLREKMDREIGGFFWIFLRACYYSASK